VKFREVILGLAIVLLFGCSENKNTHQPELPLLLYETFASGTAKNWRPNIPENWQVVDKDGQFIYEHE